MQKVGFIGLGKMGNPMAKNLIKAGYGLTVYNRTFEKCEETKKNGARIAKSPKDLAQESDVIITMLSDSVAVESVVLGKEGVAEGAKRGTILIDMSTIGPNETIRIAKEVSKVGVRMLDAPVSGGVKFANEGTLTILVGGPNDLYENQLDLFKAMGKKIFYLGPNGAGCSMKLANNLVLAITLGATAEALLLARKTGLDSKMVLDVLLAGSARSPIMEASGRAMVERKFEPAFTLRLMHKDLHLAIEAARLLGVALPLTGLLTQLHLGAIGRKLGEKDFSSILLLLESLSGVE